jgi:hypothetical protein
MTEDKYMASAERVRIVYQYWEANRNVADYDLWLAEHNKRVAEVERERIIAVLEDFWKSKYKVENYRTFGMKWAEEDAISAIRNIEEN